MAGKCCALANEAGDFSETGSTENNKSRLGSKLVLLLGDPSSRERGTAFSPMHSGFSEYGNGAEPSPGCFAKRNSNNKSKKLILMGI